MASYKNFSRRSRAEKSGANDNLECKESNNIRKEQHININAWKNFFSYYRYYVDKFAMEILGLKVFPFQRLILRAMARSQTGMLVMCRGLGGKSGENV